MVSVESVRLERNARHLPPSQSGGFLCFGFGRNPGYGSDVLCFIGENPRSRKVEAGTFAFIAISKPKNTAAYGRLKRESDAQFERPYCLQNPGIALVRDKSEKPASTKRK